MSLITRWIERPNGNWIRHTDEGDLVTVFYRDDEWKYVCAGIFSDDSYESAEDAKSDAESEYDL